MRSVEFVFLFTGFQSSGKLLDLNLARCSVQKTIISGIIRLHSVPVAQMLDKKEVK